MDQTGEARCMLFDSHAKEILGITAHDLLAGSFDEVYCLFKNKTLSLKCLRSYYNNLYFSVDRRSNCVA